MKMCTFEDFFKTLLVIFILFQLLEVCNGYGYKKTKKKCKKMNGEIAFENVLQRINYYVTLDDKDRMEYTDDFNEVLLAIVTDLKNEDPVFASLYNGPSLGGSYADNLKVSKPDEFDMVLRLKMRANHLVKVEKDKKKPGYVKINLTDVLKEIKNQQHNKTIYEKLLKLIDNQNYLLQNKLQQWIESIMTKVLKKYNYQIKTRYGKIYQVTYEKTGPAHTIKFKYQNRFISIDLVPALVFDKTKWVSLRPVPTSIDVITDWIAVPKPNKNSNNGINNISFQTSYVDTERSLIKKRYNLKNVLRMIKKIRDRHNIQNLKSYFIKTVFLWEGEKLPINFWNKSTGTILLFMLEKLIEYVEKGEMPFFWDHRENMFGNLTKFQLSNMLGQLKKINKLIQKYSTTETQKLYDIFLTEEEIKDMNNRDIPKNISNNDVIQLTNDAQKNANGGLCNLM